MLAWQIHRQQNNCGFRIPSVPFLIGKIIQQRNCGQLLLTNRAFQFSSEGIGIKFHSF